MDIKEKIEEYWGWSIPIIIGIVVVFVLWYSDTNEKKVVKYKQDTEATFLALCANKYKADTSFDTDNGKMIYWYQERIISNPKIAVHEFTIKNILKGDTGYLIYCEKEFSTNFYMKFNLKCQKGQLNYLTAGLSQNEIEESYLRGYKGCIVANIDSVYRIEFNRPETEQDYSHSIDTIVCRGNIITVLNPQALSNE